MKEKSKIVKGRGRTIMEEQKLKENKGITLIALVITIIVLLILAAVSIAMLTGENGILTQAQNAKKETSIAEEKELIALAYNAVKAEEKGGAVTAGKLDKELEKDEADATQEGTNIKVSFRESKREYIIDENGNISGEGTGTVTPPSGNLTLGKVYTDDMIGQKITYSANGQSEWIIFGKDEAGNILITTKEPVANGFTLQGGVERWLNYEDELKAACSGYATKIQGRDDITSRSITLDDINYVTGFEKPDLSSYRYTFGATDDYENKKVNYYYPSKTASGYWQVPSDENPWTPGEELDPYSYYYAEGQFIYVGPDNDFDGVQLESGKINEENYKYVVGDGYKEGTFFDPYVVASRSVYVDSSNALFGVAGVNEGYVYGYSSLCYSDADGR